MADVESNLVPFEVLSEDGEPINVGAEVEVYSHDDPTHRINHLPRRWDVTSLDELQNVGAGTVTVWADDRVLTDTPTILDYRNIVKVRVNHQIVGAWVLQQKKTEVASKDEKSGEVIECSGEGLKTWFHDAVVFPYGGLKAKSAGSRNFSFASERGHWYNPADWVTPNKIQQYSLDPTPEPFGTAPANWPDVPYAWWVWGDPDAGDDAPAGFNFFRYEFDIDASVGTKSYSIFVAGDDYFQVYMDSQEVMTFDDNYGWSQTQRIDIDELIPGHHVLAIRGKNLTGRAGVICAFFRVGDATTETAAELLTWTGQGNSSTIDALVTSLGATKDAAAAVLAGLAPTDEGYDVAYNDYQDALAAYNQMVGTQTWIHYQEENSNVGWLVNAYPDPAPGWTPGEIVLTLLAEATARGVNFPSWLTPTFDEDSDSKGDTWDRSLDWSFDLGDEYSDVIQQLEEVVCDVWINPETLELNMYAQRGTDRTVQSTAVTPVKFEVGKNIVKADAEGSSEIKNTLMLQTNDGWQLQADGVSDSISVYGRIEGTLSTGASADVSGDVAVSVFAIKAKPMESVTYDIISVKVARPYVNFTTGDWVLAPGADGSLEPTRILSLSLAEDEKNGQPQYALEFGTISQSREDRYERWLKALSNSTLGGSVINAGGGGSGSSASGSSAVRTAGPTGAKGDPGATGLIFRGAWSPILTYAWRDSVTYDYQTWYALKASLGVTPGTDPTSWTLLAARGGSGLGVNWLGDWSSATTYAVNDAVAYGGTSYIALLAGTNHSPSSSPTYWQVLAQKGDTGAAVPRETASLTTSSLSNGAQQQTLIEMSYGYRIYQITTDKPARVRLYGTAAKRAADATRPIGTDPEGDHGLLFEFVTTADVLSAYLSPLVDGANFEDPVSIDIPITVTNLSGSSGTVTVDLVYAVTE